MTRDGAGSIWVGPENLIRVVLGGLFLRPSLYRQVAETSASWRLCLAALVLGRAGRGWADSIVAGGATAVAIALEVLLGFLLVLLEAGLLFSCARAFLPKARSSFSRLIRPVALAHVAEVVAFLLAALLVGGEVSVTVLQGLLELSWIWQIAALVVAVQAALGVPWPGAIALTFFVGLLQRSLPLLIELGFGTWPFGA